MSKIGYLLNRFPRVTDTFIMRELRALQKSGADVKVVSVWKPKEQETSSEILREWADTTAFLIPDIAKSIVVIVCAAMIRSPVRFVETIVLALRTSRVGLRGRVYQFFYFLEAVLAADFFRKQRIDHVHNHFGDHSGIVTLLAARLANISYSISFHGPHVFFDGASEHIKEKVSSAAFVRCISYFCRSQVVLFSGESDISTLKVIHCGVNIPEYKFRLPTQEIKTIFCAARLAPEKGFEFLLRAMRILKDRGHFIELRLVGDGPIRSDLESLSRELVISDRVRFLGAVDEITKTRELHSADLFVLPSLAEGLPSSVTEAMAVGVPVIATNIAATGELVEDGKTGLLVPATDAEALADAVTKMIEDFPFRVSAAKLGREKVAAEFDVDVETGKLRTCFLQAIRGRAEA